MTPQTNDALYIVEQLLLQVLQLTENEHPVKSNLVNMTHLSNVWF